MDCILTFKRAVKGDNLLSKDVKYRPQMSSQNLFSLMI